MKNPALHLSAEIGSVTDAKRIMEKYELYPKL